MTTNDGSTHHIQVGALAHRIVAHVLREGWPDQRHERNALVVRAGRAEMDAQPVTYRPREALLEAVTAAGVYLWRFQPAAEWTPVMIEQPLFDVRPDVVFEHADHGVLIDELKIGVGRSGEDRVRAQIDRYVEAGSARWADRFIGVRLCSVHEPGRSRIHLPGRRRSLLTVEHALAEEIAPR